MKFSINKGIKENSYFFILYTSLLYFLGLNISIFEKYWEEKEYWEDLQTHWTKETYWSLEEFERYVVITPNDFIIVYESWEGLLNLLFVGVVFIFYIIIPLISVLVTKKISLKSVLFIDACVLIFSFFAFITIFLDILKTGIIPLYIFIPIMILILLVFRIYQYKKKSIFHST